MSCANSVLGQTTKRALIAPLTYDLWSGTRIPAGYTTPSSPFSLQVVAARGHDQLQNHLHSQNTAAHRPPYFIDSIGRGGAI